jgi:hypothetical protein
VQHWDVVCPTAERHQRSLNLFIRLLEGIPTHGSLYLQLCMLMLKASCVSVEINLCVSCTKNSEPRALLNSAKMSFGASPKNDTTTEVEITNLIGC